MQSTTLFSLEGDRGAPSHFLPDVTRGVEVATASVTTATTPCLRELQWDINSNFLSPCWVVVTRMSPINTWWGLHVTPGWCSACRTHPPNIQRYTLLLLLVWSVVSMWWGLAARVTLHPPQMSAWYCSTASPWPVARSPQWARLVQGPVQSIFVISRTFFLCCRCLYYFFMLPVSKTKFFGTNFTYLQ